MSPNPDAHGNVDEDAEKLIALYEEQNEDTSEDSYELDKLLTKLYWEKRRAGALPRKKSLWQQFTEYLQGVFAKAPAQ
jgi:predicted acetyltransferase